MVGALQDLEVFERHADAAMAKLPLWQLPIRSLLSLLYLSADSQYVGERFRRRKSQRNEDVGTAIISRMSYVMNFLVQGSRQIGADVDDALSVFDASLQDDVKDLLGYAHFCEVMPLARRGFFTVEHGPAGFSLKHPHQQFATHEETDVLLSELVLARDLAPPPHPIDACKRIVKTWPTVPGDDLVTVLQGAYNHYLANVFELELLSAEGFRESFGFSRGDFVQVRAALMAYADFCLGMADAAEHLALSAFTRPRRQALEREVREWAAPLLNRNHIVGLAAGIAGVDPDIADRIVTHFTLNPDNTAASGGGEGFFPPFLILGDALLFSPHGVKRMMPERNLLYALRQTDPSKFDQIVSRHLEPALLADAAQCFSALPGVEIRRNVEWHHGEIDLLAYHAASNTAVHVEAKAAVPPQGARMIAQIEARTLEAAEQLRRFKALSDEDKCKAASIDPRVPPKSVAWTGAVLVRTCLGTEKAWSRISGHTPLNPVLLRAALKRILTDGEFSFAKLDAAVTAELEDLRHLAVRGWTDRSFALFGKTIELPLLDLDYPAIAAYRSRALA
ncbi:MAG: hypothetical protein EBS23_02855 [Betaproteobacteria bacterium]|nr:hypothetical protein [Betaproteobacteria bacterium]